jgi:hypothetical protein
MPGLTEIGRRWNDAVESAGQPQPWNTLGFSDPGMTHEAEQPDQAQRYLDLIKRGAAATGAFARGGITGLLRQQGVQIPEWSNRIGDVLQSEAANTAFGVMTPIKGTGVRMGIPEFEDYPRAVDVRSNMNSNLRYPDFERQQAALADIGKEITPPAAAPGSKIPALVVARRFPSGEVVYGEPGKIHTSLLTKKEYGGGDYPADTEAQMGFAEPGGKFMGRQEAMDWAKKNEPSLADYSEASVNQPGFGLEAGSYQRGAKQAAGELPSSPEKIQAAATRYGGKVYTGNVHVQSLEAAAADHGMDVSQFIDKVNKEAGKTEATHDLDGFVTSGGRFVNREEARAIADRAEQLTGLAKEENNPRLSMEEIKVGERPGFGQPSQKTELLPFNDQTVGILKKYGLLGLFGGAASQVS